MKSPYILILRWQCLIDLLLLTVFTSSCASTSTKTFLPLTKRERSSFEAKGANGMIATAHPLASIAGLEMLQAGGNAIDAATAASFVISVVRPQSTGIGGGGFMLYYDQSKKNTLVYDFRERAPINARRSMYLDKNEKPIDYLYQGVRIPKASVNGHLSVAVPGLIAGLIETQKKHGTLPLKTVMAPAIKVASEGFKVYPSLAKAILKRLTVMKNFRATRSIFIPEGKPLKAGDLLVQKDLAKTLQLIASHGKDGFYKGETAQKILAELKHTHIFSQKDFDEYQVIERKPITGMYRGHKIVSMPPPSSGGTHIIQILNILSQDPIKEIGLNSPEGIHILAEAMRRAYADRAKYLGDPDFVNVPTKGLTSPLYAKELRQSINVMKATPSKSLHAGNPIPYESKSTTHISVVDKWGNGVSTTQTINYTFGSCVVAAGTGIVLNNEMDDFSIKPGQANAYGLVGGTANAISAKKTMLSSMSPTLVFDPEDHLKMVVGSPGGPRIITATLQAIINTIDHQLPPRDAVHAYRIHNQWYPDEIRIEQNSLSTSTVEDLQSLGHKVKTYETPVGDVQAIIWDPKHKLWIGVSDTRSDGVPMGL